MLKHGRRYLYNNLFRGGGYSSRFTNKDTFIFNKFHTVDTIIIVRDFTFWFAICFGVKKIEAGRAVDFATLDKGKRSNGAAIQDFRNK